MPDIWNKYVSTAARKHGGARGKRPQTPTVDIHSHVSIPAAAEYVRPHLPPPDTSAVAETLELGKRQNADRASRLATLNERLGELDAMMIDIQVIKPSPFQCYYDVPPDVRIKAAQMVNDGMAEYAAKHPRRFVPFGTVPLPDGAAAAAELERAATKLGFKGVQILTTVSGRPLCDPAFEPFWAKAEALGTLVVLHPSGFAETTRFNRFYFNNVIGNPLDTTVAIHDLIFDGVLERHPNLKILAVHGGGYAPAYMGRMDHGWGARSDAHGTLPHPPTYYLRKFYFDTVVFTPQQLEYLVRVFGADRIMMGTDYPFDMGEYDPVEHIMSVESFDAATISAVAGGTARRLLAL